MGARRAAEPLLEFPRKKPVVAEAGSKCYLAQRQVLGKQVPAMQQALGMRQAQRLYELAARSPLRREQFLEVAQRDPGFRGHLARTEIRIGKSRSDDAADFGEQLFGMKGGGCRIGR